MQNTNIQQRSTPRRRIIPANVFSLGIVSLFTDLSSEMIYPLLPVFLAGLVPLGYVAVYVGLMEGAADSIANLLKIFSGRFSDILKKRKLLAVLGYGISTVARPLMAIASAGWHTLAIRSVDRIGKGIRTAPRDALISDSVDPSIRALAFSFHRAMDHLGAVLGPVCSILILYLFLGRLIWRETTDVPSIEEMRVLRWLFAAALVPGFFAMAALVLKVRDVAHVPDARTVSAPSDLDPRAKPLPRKFYRFLFIVTLFTLGNSSDLFLVFYARTKFSLGLLPVIVMWIVLHISKVVFSLPGGLLSDRFGRRAMLVVGWTVYVFVYASMIVVASRWFFWTLIVIYGAYYGMTEGAERALVADYVPPDRRGKAYGLYHGLVGLAVLPASTVFGFLWASFGPQLAFALGASAAALATILLLLSTQLSVRQDNTGLLP
jgi:MFS family permease